MEPQRVLTMLSAAAALRHRPAVVLTMISLSVFLRRRRS